LALLMLGILPGCKRDKPPATERAPASDVQPVPVADRQSAPTPVETAVGLFREPKVSIQNIVKAAQDRWTPAYEQWWDRAAPDFTLTDIEGQTHKLSDYQGKDVVVAFWATWVGACKLEVGHLKELRSAYPKDKLAILAITKEPAALVKKWAADQGINYTVLSDARGLPAPFDQAETVPCSFFVGPDGKFKLAINGMVPASDAKAIVEAR
jgi:peroxiredoxin